MTTPAIILLAIVCIVIGMVIAYLFQSLRNVRTGDKTPSQQGMSEKARLWEKDQALVVEIDGHQYGSPAELDAEQTHSLRATSEELSRWLAGSETSAAAKTLSAEMPSPISSEAYLAKFSSTGEVQSVSRPAEGSRRVGLDISRVMTSALRLDVPNPSAPTSKSIAAQVDEILQERVAGTPLEQRGIRVMDAPDGGIRILVGLEKYDGVEAVPDEAVRNAIREAVLEWRKRTVRGE